MSLMGVTIPEEYGGAGSDMLGRAISIEEISRANATVGIIVAASGLACDCLETAGHGGAEAEISRASGQG